MTHKEQHMERRAFRPFHSEPSEEAIQKVVAETGMGYLQARNHLIQRNLLSQRKDPYPLGKTQHFA